MVKPTDLVVWLKDLDRDDVHYVGGKSANLGEMIQAGFPVPAGFAITSTAYSLFLRENRLEKPILHLLNSINYDDPNSIRQVSDHIKKIISQAKFPEEIHKQVFSYYEKMYSGNDSPLVAIRSSATSEDSKEASFAGQQETFLNVRGEAALMHKVREAWASLFEARAIFYRHQNKFDHLKTKIALVVQLMVESESSGIMFTIDPVTNDKNTIVIEAIYGLGEYIVQGRVTPDHYEVDKKNLHITNKHVVTQDVMMVKAHTDNKEVNVPKKVAHVQKITDRDILTLAELAKKLEKHYFFPQDSEWAKENGKIYLVQTRPITTISDNKKTDMSVKSLDESAHIKPILIGDPASPGIGMGPVRILKNAADMGKIKKGDVLVAEYTNPDYVPAMRKAAAIITEKGGRTSHAAIVSREFGIPAIVGVPQALKKLKDGMMVTVNGRSGNILKGNILLTDKKSESAIPHLKTKTQVFINVAEPELAEKTAALNVDGVGLLRAEFMMANFGVHPKKLIHEKKSSEFVNTLADGIGKICTAFYPRPVLYRATDFKTNEYRNLIGGHDYEPVESNPMIGYRGAYRYIHDPKVFELELRAIQKVREKMKLNNLQLMLPFVRTVQELQRVKKIINDFGLRRSATFKLYLMCELPSNVILIDEFLRVGIDGVSIGSNDLTMLIMGIDRDSEEVAPEFDERNPAVLWALEHVVRSCKKKGVPVSICGQAPSNFPDLVEKLVDWGVDSVSVAPDAVDTTREFVYKAEHIKT